jgi:uncharacterized protein YegL
MVRFKRLRKLLTITFAISILAVLALTPSTVSAGTTVPVKTQVGLCIDGSGSISDTNWDIMLDGLSKAIKNNVPTDSSVELTIVQFSSGAQVEVGPIIIDSQATADSIATAVLGISQLNANTWLGTGLNLLVDTMMNSTTGFVPEWRVINISTDGEPYPNNQVALAEAAYDNAIDKVNEIDAEAIGNGPDVNWLLTEMVYPILGGQGTEVHDGDQFPPRPPSGAFEGFVYVIDSFDDYAAAISQKFDVITQPDVIPGISSWGIIAAVAAIGTAGVVILRRRQAEQVS